MDDKILPRMASLYRFLPECLNTFLEEELLGEEMQASHRQTIDMRRNFPNVSDAILSDEFLEDLRRTLVAFRMNQRGVKLKNRREFFRQFRENRDSIVELEQWSIEDILDNPQIVKDVWCITRNLRITESNRNKGKDNASPVVPGTKALHHLLPNLVPPIDREYTSSFFSAAKYPDPNRWILFSTVFEGYVQLMQCVEEHYGENYLANLVDTDDWYSSKIKIIDNAIIGFPCFLRNYQAQITNG